MQALLDRTVGMTYVPVPMNEDQLWGYALPAVGALLALLCLWAAARSGRRRRLVENLPTSKTTGVFIGLVELKGTAESEQPLISYLAERRCVYYRWSVAEHWSRTVTETYTDSKGRTRTRTRRESGWKTVAEDVQSQPFYLKDDQGVIRVLPDGAKIEPLTMFHHVCGRSDPLYYGKGPHWAVAHSDHRRRFSEWGIPLHTPIYVMGQARERKDIVAPEIAADREAPMFLISTRSEAQVSRGLKWAQYGWTFAGGLLAVGGFFAGDLVQGVEPAMRWPAYVLAAAGYAMAAMVGWGWMVYNGLVDLRNRVQRAWSHVDVQLKRRHDLIPSLVGIVAGYADHEQRVQRELALLRSQASATPPGQPGPDLQAVRTQVLAILERYPDLKANQLFLRLQKELSDTEQRLALARDYFNEIATHYNTRLEVVPERFIAALGRFKPQSLLVAQDFERSAVTVKLDTSD